MNKQEYHEYLKTPEWAVQRDRAIASAGRRCQVCNSSSRLEVHHRTYDNIGHEDASDLTVLCDPCHDLFHSSTRELEAVPLEQALNEFYDDIDTRHKENDWQQSGISTGYIDLDAITAGLQASELTIIGSRPSVGKTALAINIARHVAFEEGLPVLFFSLEQSRKELAERMLCSHASVDSHKMRRAHLSHDEMQKLIHAGGELRLTKLFIDDSPRHKITTIQASAALHKNKHDIRLIIIDYIQLIEPEWRRESRHEQVAHISRQLKIMAKELAVPVIVCAQLNRESESRGESKPRLSDLRDSGGIEQDADVVLLLHKPECFSLPDELPADGSGSILNVIVAKHRNGPRGEFSAIFLEKFQRIIDVGAKTP